MSDLTERRRQSASRMGDLERRLFETEERAGEQACVYVTGSYGRGEASQYSDLDLFIVGKTVVRDDDEQTRCLTRLDEICLKADLIRATRDMKFQEFSVDGRFLVHYTVYELVKTLGRPEDDVTNTFTARVLLLLESQPLLGKATYKMVLEEVVRAYWRDFDDHKENFIPAFLANDILRLWRTFCVNYEAGTERDPPEKKAKGKLKNYKLKHSRLLTCYSALLYLLTIYKNHNTVSVEDVLKMIGMTPTKRLEWLQDHQSLSHAREEISLLLAKYDIFLMRTNNPESDLVEIFSDKEKGKLYLNEASVFGDLVYRVLMKIGEGSQFHRLLVV